MARSYTPDLDAIAELANSEVKFYAIVGAVVSLTSALEHRLVDIFQKSLSIGSEQATAMLIDIRASSVQRDLALTAMRFKIEPDETLRTQWADLEGRIKTATGQSGKRNVVGHNPVSTHIAASGAISGAPISALPIGAGPTWQFLVHVPPERLIGKKPPRAVDFKTLLEAAKTLAALIRDVDTFLDAL
jgi:hypothetical protein